MTTAAPTTRAIVTDIEGTTSAISFVTEVLFPYARKRLPAFIETHGDTPDVQHWLQEAAREADIIRAERNEIIDLLIRWIDEDRKSTALKALQGMIWKDGYESGAFRGNVYPDVAPQLQRWHADGIKLYVYSSGSVPAQELLFKYSDAGDLTPLFVDYFDTETGPKRDWRSYGLIADAIDAPATQILFLSDTTEELDAAAKAGLRTTQICRPPDTCAADAAHPCVSDFTQIEV